MARVRGVRLLARLGIDRERAIVDIDEDGSGPCRDHRETGEGGGQGRDEHFITSADIECAKCERDRIGSVRHADREARAGCGGELRFELLDLRAEDVPTACDDAIDGAANRGGVVGRVQVDERQARGSAHSAATSDVVET